MYEAKTIFANIEAVVLAAETFLRDLEGATLDSVSSICLSHVGRCRRGADGSCEKVHSSPIERTLASKTNHNACFKT